MAELRRIVLVRHGETVAQSSIRFWGGRTNVDLSEEGRRQVLANLPFLSRQSFDLVVASPLRRAWDGARLLVGSAPILILEELREVDFGDWEGLTKDEIQLRDPVLYDAWQSHESDFAYPGGEARPDFRARVRRGVEKIAGSGATEALVVCHKGVIRLAVEELRDEPLPDGAPDLGGLVDVVRDASGHWILNEAAADSG